MAGCPPLWLLSEGQASESDSPRGEKIRYVSMQSLVVGWVIMPFAFIGGKNGLHTLKTKTPDASHQAFLACSGQFTFYQLLYLYAHSE